MLVGAVAVRNAILKVKTQHAGDYLMQIGLGLRLQKVADFVPVGAYIADIGSDHGYLAAWLLQCGKIGFAIAGELNKEPAERARQTARAAGLQEQMWVREGAGLTILLPGEVDTVVIAGMGGITIIEILESNPAVLPHLQRLVLQPNVAGSQVRYWLADHDWKIVDEALVLENDILYEIIVAEPGKVQPLTALQAEIGPVLMSKRPEHFHTHVQLAIEERRYVASQLLRSSSIEAVSRRQILLLQASELESLLL